MKTLKNLYWTKFRIIKETEFNRSQDSAAGIATGYGLDD
jgi:hypothetical protein